MNGIYDLATQPISAPVTGTDAASLIPSSLSLRNTGLSSLLSQLGGPSQFSSFYSPAADTAAGQLRTGRNAGAANLAKRGLAQSGAGLDLEKQLQLGYGGELSSALTSASSQEDARKRKLQALLYAFPGADMSFLDSMFGGELAKMGVDATQKIDDYRSQAGIASGIGDIFNLGSIGSGLTSLFM